ncbi:putative Adhesion G protein-coupled receptor L3 [Hypsibius exemplaris]|uniref:Adhesion G protein-coupled receptor L3 n=1 Tax=Hypsibius exemplaris TaxID=2072580 RepID=A0A1W0WK76_HYPEX|nr:putative Adhesion G protein-coupled receptor L3 [Hypsibius exemplaris]
MDYPDCKQGFAWLLAIGCLFLKALPGNGQVVFVGLKDVYEIQNRQPADVEVATFMALDESGSTARLVYDLYDADALPFRIDRYSGKLFTVRQFNLPIGRIMPITLVATNILNGQDVRAHTKLRITMAVNSFAPSFPTNGSTIFLQRNATASTTVWIADTIDEDPDEINNDITYRTLSLTPEGYLEFIEETGELKLLKDAKDLPDRAITLSVTACNGPNAKPPRCGTGVVSVAIVIPQQGALLGMLDDISAEKLSAVADAVEIMSEYAKKDVKVAQSMVNVVSAVLNLDAVTLDNIMPSQVSTKLTGSVGSYANDAVIPADRENVRMQTDNLEISLVDVQNDFNDPFLRFSSACNDTRAHVESNLSFSIPTDVVRSGSHGSDGSVRVSLVRYDNSKLFKLAEAEPPIVRRTVINCTSYAIQDSPVVVAVVKGANTESLVKPVMFRMPKPTQNLKYRCVYWDETANRWASEGVAVSRQSEGEIECEAHHMTAFSVLFDPTPDVQIEESHKFALSLISYIGCSLSIFGCFATVLTYCFFRHLRVDNAGKILINLCVAIGFLNVAFVVGSFLSTSVLPFKLPCAVMSSVIHFFSLASFMWMGIEAFNMYQLLIRVFFTVQQKHFILKRAILGWGVPALVAVATSLLEVYNGENVPYGNECRLTPGNKFVYYAAFLSPFALIIICNTIVFIMVIFVLCKPRPDFVNVAGKKSDAAPKSVKGAQVHGALAVMFLLGVTWVFGAMAISHARLLFQYVFCITNSIQGFLIFVFRCLERQEVRVAWARFFRTGQRRPAPASSMRGGTTRSRDSAFSSTASDTRLKKNVDFDMSASSEQDVSRKPLLTKRPGQVNRLDNGEPEDDYLINRNGLNSNQEEHDGGYMSRNGGEKMSGRAATKNGVAGGMVNGSTSTDAFMEEDYTFPNIDDQD